MLLDCEYCAESAGCRYILAQEEGECPYRKLVKDRETVRLVNQMRRQVGVNTNNAIANYNRTESILESGCRKRVEKKDEKKRRF